MSRPVVPPPRWLDDAASPGTQALRQALDDVAGVPEVPANRQRVWSRVQAPWAPRRGRIFLGVGLTAALAGAVLLVGVVRRPAQDGVSSRVGAPATAPLHDPVAPMVVPLPTELPAPSPSTATLLTGPGERLQRRLARGVDVGLSPLTALLAGDDEAPPEVKSGHVRFAVPHQAAGRSYSVRAGDYRVVVLGTVFDVGVDTAGVSVDLQAGAVDVEDVRSGQRVAHLSPGQRWTSAAGEAGVAAPAVPPPAAAGEAAPPSARAARGGGAPAAGASAEASSTAAPLLAAARQARKDGDARVALALYGRLARGGGQLAESAQYEMATIEGEDLHDPARALRSWERYREQHPRGVLRPEADLSIIEMLTRLGQSQRALDESRGFLRRNPGSERRGEVARVAGDLARTRGDCATAVAFYEQALPGRLSTSDADDVTFHRLNCLATLGDARAPDAAAAYLGRFPRGRHTTEATRLRAAVRPEGTPRP